MSEPAFDAPAETTAVEAPVITNPANIGPELASKYGDGPAAPEAPSYLEAAAPAIEPGVPDRSVEEMQEELAELQDSLAAEIEFAAAQLGVDPAVIEEQWERHWEEQQQAQLVDAALAETDAVAYLGRLAEALGPFDVQAVLEDARQVVVEHPEVLEQYEPATILQEAARLHAGRNVEQVGTAYARLDKFLEQGQFVAQGDGYRPLVARQAASDVYEAALASNGGDPVEAMVDAVDVGIARGAGFSDTSRMSTQGILQRYANRTFVRRQMERTNPPAPSRAEQIAAEMTPVTDPRHIGPSLSAKYAARARDRKGQTP